MIQLQNITLRREDHLILDRVNLEVKENEHWVILGRNGSGKTTLLELITGYLFPSDGQVKVMGNLYGDCDVREVRKKIGYISQSLVEKLALRDPVWEVVATGEYGFLRFYQAVPDEARAKAEALLDEVNLGRLRDHPLGTLSQGERKKVMLARALMSEPSVLIMDEPCAGLDLYEREKFLDQLNMLQKRDITLIYVTHHMEEIIPIFTHVALIHQGKVIAAGDKRSVLTSETLMRAYEVPVSIDWQNGRPWTRVVSAHDGGS